MRPLVHHTKPTFLHVCMLSCFRTLYSFMPKILNCNKYKWFMLQGRSLAATLCILSFQRKSLCYSSSHRNFHGQNAFLCFQSPIEFQIWILTKQSVKVSNSCHLLGLELMMTFSAESWGGNLQLSPWPSLLPYSMTSTCPSGTLHFNKYLWPVVMVPLLS